MPSIKKEVGYAVQGLMQCDVLLSMQNPAKWTYRKKKKKITAITLTLPVAAGFEKVKKFTIVNPIMLI